MRGLRRLLSALVCLRAEISMKGFIDILEALQGSPFTALQVQVNPVSAEKAAAGCKGNGCFS